VKGKIAASQGRKVEAVEYFDLGVDILDAAFSLDGQTDRRDQLSGVCWDFARNNTLVAQCSTCGCQPTTGQWRRINALVVPEIKKALLTRELFTCPGCRKQVLFDYKIVYHDPVKKLLVLYVPDGHELDLVSDVNVARYVQAGYEMRAVRSQLGLAEKVLLAEHTICDISVELFKLSLWGQLTINVVDKAATWVDQAWDSGLYVVDIQESGFSLQAGEETLTCNAKMPGLQYLGKAYLQQFIADSFGSLAPKVQSIVERIQSAKGWFLVEWRDIAGGVFPREGT
jgi:hypothetical protein